MSQHDDLIRRLCEASEGSAELSAEVWTALTGVEHIVIDDEDVGVVVMRKADVLDAYFSAPCLTTSLSAAWAEVRARKKFVLFASDARQYPGSMKIGCYVRIGTPGIGNWSDTTYGEAYAETMPLALCAALLAAEGER